MKPVRSKKLAAREPGQSLNGGSSSKLPIFLALVLIAGLIALKFSRQRPEAAATSPAKSFDEPQIIEGQKQLVKMQRAGQQRTMLLVSERAAGLDPLPLEKVEGRPPVLKVELKPVSRSCIPGDLDIIKQDMEWRVASSPQLVLSLEPLDARSNIKPVQKKMSLEEMSEGFSTDFVLEEVKERQLMGLFLCSVRKNGTCAGEEQASMNDLQILQKNIRTGKRPGKDYPKGNKIYSFMLLVAYPDRLLIHDPQQSLESSKKRLEAALAKGGEPASPLLMADVMKRLRAAGSIPAIVQSRSVQIPLPHKEARCP